MVDKMRELMAVEQISRLEARLPASVYAILKRAAQLKGRTLTDFVVSAAHDAAQRACQQKINGALLKHYSIRQPRKLP